MPLLFFFLGQSFLPISSTDVLLQQAREQNTATFKDQLSVLEQQVSEYATSAADPQMDLEILRTNHLATRIQFKRVEYLLEYIDPESVRRYLNGAPLPKTEPHVPEVAIIQPKGLQVLDEQVFEDIPDREEVERLTKELAKNFRTVYSYVQNRQLNHRHFFEAMRLELVRIFTLGITGFDTPGSVNAMPEATAALEATADCYRNYSRALNQVDGELAMQLLTTFNRAVSQLKGADFDTFDRAAFLRDYLNPLTEGLVQAQQLLEIEFASQVDPRPAPVNMEAELLFDANWLSTEYYAQLSPSPYDEERTSLGQLLFYDPILSSNNQRSCASCHNPEKGFTDGYAKSRAIDGQGFLLRNSPGLVNSVYADRYFYDLREEYLERQMKHVFLDSREFGTSFPEIIEKLQQSEEYQDLFAAAYADNPTYSISAWSISDALSHYVSSLVSHDSPFDRYARGETDEYPAAALRGFNLFTGKAACASCHFSPTFSGLVPPQYAENESEVLAVPFASDTAHAQVDPDLGRVNSYRPIDETYYNVFAFKTPGLRNVALTAPYMHNGVYQSLAEVVDFYNRGGGYGIGIELEHQTLPPDPLGLSQQEMADLVSFMETLTDTVGLTQIPVVLPQFDAHPAWNERTIGGTY